MGRPSEVGKYGKITSLLALLDKAGLPNPVLKIYQPEELSSNPAPKTPMCNYQVLLKIQLSQFRYV